MSLFGLRLSDMVSAAPSLQSSPGIAVSLAANSGATPDDAQLTAAAMDGRVLADYLNQLPSDMRPNAWAQFTPQQRALAYYGGGYTDMESVTAKQQDQGLFDKVLDKTVDSAKWAGGKALDAVSTVLRPIDYAGEQVRHGFRAGVATNRAGGGPEWTDPIAGIGGIFAAPVAQLTNDKEFLKAWRDTQTVKGGLQVTGQDYFDPAAEAQVRSRYTPEAADFAFRLAKGETIADLVAEVADNPQEAARRESILRTSIIADAVREFDGARLSYGRVIARSWLGMDPTSAGWNKVTGIIDGVGTIFADPTLIGGKVNKTYKLGKYGMGSLNARRVDELFDTNAVKAHWDQIAEPLNAVARNDDNAAEALQTLRTQFRDVDDGLRNQLIEHARESKRDFRGADDFREFFKEKINQVELIRGQAAYRERLIPRKNFLERNVTDRVRRVANKPIDWLEGGPGMAARLGVYNRDAPSAQAQAKIEELKKRYEQDAGGTLALDFGQSKELQAKIDEILDEDALVSRGIKTAELRGESVSRLRDRLPAATEGVKGLRGKGATTPMQSDEFKRSERVRFRAAQAMARFSNRVATGHQVDGRRVFDLTADDATEQVFRLGRAFLTKQGANEVAAMFDAANLAGRRRIFKGLRRSVAEAAGLGKTEEGVALMKKWDGADEEIGRTYSAFGQDRLADGSRSAVMSWQQEPHMSMPDYREMRGAAAKVGILSHFGDMVTADFLDRGMSAWRALVLLNFRRIFREGTEERGRAMISYGAFDTVKGAAANRTVRRATRDASRRFADPDNQKSFEDLFAEGMAERLEKPGFLTRIGLSNEDAQNYLRQINPDQVETFHRDIANLGVQADRMFDAGFNEEEIRRYGGKLRRITIRPTGDFKEISAADDRGAQAWAYVLRRIAASPDGQMAMRHIDNQSAAVDELTKLILSKQWKKTREGSDIFREAKRLNGDSDLAGAREWARRIHAEVRGHFTDKQGNLLGDLLDDVMPVSDDGARRVLDATKLTSGRLNEIDAARRPEWVIAPELVHVDDQVSMAAKLVRGGYAGLESANNAISRGPVYWAHWVQARKDLQAWEDDLANVVGEKEARALATKNADKMATARTLDGIDNPEIRSEFAVIARNMIPFWRAQEEFYRRWARTARYKPEALRKAALTYEGLQHSGFIQTDDQNQDFFLYPGTNLAAATMNRVGKLFGQDWAMTPEVFNLKGQVRFLNSGFDPKNIQPSFGPLAAAPVKALNAFLPESKAAQDIERLALGDQGAGIAFWRSLIPTDIRRAYDATGFWLTETPQIEAQAMRTAAWQEQQQRKQQLLREQASSATIRTIQMLEAAGLTPPEGASDEAVEIYRDRLTDHARMTLGLRAFLGAFLPAAPEMDDIAPALPRLQGSPAQLNVKDEYQQIVNKVGYEKAYAIWVERHPDELPLMEGTTKSDSGAYLSASKSAGDFITDNRDLFKRYPKAASFLIPMADDAKFDQDTFQIQRAMGLRKNKDWKDFYLGMKLTGYTGAYYRTKAKFDDAIADADAGGRDSSPIQEQWKAWSDEYQNEHPLLRTYIREGGNRAADREHTFDELRRMVQFGHGPDTPAMKAITEMVNTYDQYKAEVSALGGARTQSAQNTKDLLRSRFDARVADIAATDLNADMLWSRLLRYMED